MQHSADPSNGKTIWVFTPSRTAPEDLEFILVQRQALLQDAVERVRESALTGNKHHLLFVGPRGCGKTHFVTLAVSRLGADETLKERLRIAWLNEDETCTTVLELLMKVHAALEKRYPGEYREDMLSAAYDMKPDAALKFVSEHILSTLGSRTLLVVCENLDAIFEGLGDSGQKQLRSFIQEHPQFSLLATAQRLVEDLSERTSPFFGFFQTEHLKPLNVEQATELLQKIARLQNKKEVVAFLATSRGRSRVRAIHHLSGGNHRIYIVLAQFITRDSVDALLEPFMKMVDELTPYYQERIRWLPPLQRKIVEYLCTCEGTVPVKEIAKKLFSSPQTISSQLQDLREKGYLESNQRGRESLYEISEPLMRICIEVKDNQRLQPLRLLVDFLRVWYDDHELKHRLGKMEPASAACAYLHAAIQRNSAEGNLRMKLMMEDLGLVVPDSLPPELLAKLTQDMPEALLISAQCSKDGDQTEAIDCLTESIAWESDPAKQSALLVMRALLFSEEKKFESAISDFTMVIGLPGAPVEYVSKAFYNRGVLYGQASKIQCAIDDYTAVIGLAGAPVERISMALVNRGIIYGQASKRQRAIDDYTAVIGLCAAPVDQTAKAFFSRGIIHAQEVETQRAIDDYTAVIGLQDAPIELVVMALVNRGSNYGRVGEIQRQIDDCTAAVDFPGAPAEHVATALFNRGNAHCKAGRIQCAIDDYTAVIGLPDVPVERVAMARFNRGVIHDNAGEGQRAIDDYTAIIKLSGAPIEQVVVALINRGNAYNNEGETQRAIDDYSMVIGLSGASVDQIAMSLVNRGITNGKINETQRAIDDFNAVVALSGAPIKQVALALYFRGLAYLQQSRKQEAQTDFEALTHLEEAPVEKVVDAHLALSELYWSEGRWSEGVAALEAALTRGAKVQPAYHGAPTELIGIVFVAGFSPEGRREKVFELLRLYQQHQALPVLGEGLIQHLGNVFRAGEPFPSSDNLEGWASAWEKAAENVPDFRLSLRLMRTSIQWLKAGGKDRSILLDLASAERSIVEQAMGLVDES